MDKTLTEIQKLIENLELVAFLVSKGGREREAHGKVVESLVILAQLEAKFKNNNSNCTFETNTYEVSSSQPGKGKLNTFKGETEIYKEIEKVTRRVQRWFRNLSQYNSTILLSFLSLSEQVQMVSLQELRSKCSSIKDFDGNYNQMKNFGEKNHGKVFEERDGYVTLWEPVKEYILELYNEN